VVSPKSAKHGALVCAAASLLKAISLLLVSASANANHTPNPGQAPKIRSTVSLVLVDALVADKKTGTPIEDLAQGDFQLRDNGKPVELTRFNRGKDHTLRQVQVWFVLLCNEELHFPMGVRRGTEIIATQNWGASFLAGKTAELLPALAHLNDDEAIGVAHWCDNGESEIDLAPTLERASVLQSIEQIARKKPVQQNHGPAGPSGELTRRINDVARTGFPEPLPALIFIGGRQGEDAGGPSADPWFGLIEESSMDFGLAGESLSGSADSSQNGDHTSDYVKRLGIYFDSLHRRYELGFVPVKQGNELHHLGLTLTKAVRERYPNAVLRYRELYGDEDGTKPGNSRATDWKNLDSKMRAAVNSPANQEALKFETRKTADAAGGTEQFVIRIAPDDLTWKMLPDGDRRCVVTIVAASYSTKGRPIGVTVRQLEIVQEFAQLALLKDKPVSLSFNVTEPKGTAKVRLMVRDVATGHIGTQDVRGE
jgi:hypothetical protein